MQIFVQYTKNKSDLSNNRPISLTSIPCKVIKRFIRGNILKHCTDNNLFNNKLYGFLKGRSTMLQLLRIMDEWTKCLESGGQINVIYADFERAFNTVSRKFLCNWKQRAKTNGFY